MSRDLIYFSPIPWRGLFRTLYFLPVVCTLVAVAILWRWIFNPDYGLMNYFLGLTLK